MLRIILTKVCS